MNIGHVSNMNYIVAAGRVNSPTIRPAFQSGLRPNTQSITPNAPVARPGLSTSNLFFNLDGDRAEISDRARGLSFLDANQRPLGSDIMTNYQFNLPNPIIVLGNGAPVDVQQGPALPESANDAMLEALEPSGSCYTCENRKYVDQSDDASVSFQTPTKISPNMAAAAVSAHENEHVRNEQARAQRDDREIVSQTVTLQYDTCPECGKQYVSGGTTRTTSISKSDSDSMLDTEGSFGDNMQ